MLFFLQQTLMLFSMDVQIQKQSIRWKFNK